MQRWLSNRAQSALAPVKLAKCPPQPDSSLAFGGSTRHDRAVGSDIRRRNGSGNRRRRRSLSGGRHMAKGGEPKTERVLTVHDVAEEYGVKPKTVYRWLSRKKNPLHGIKLPGGDWRFRREHLEAWERCLDTGLLSEATDCSSEEQSGQSSTP